MDSLPKDVTIYPSKEKIFRALEECPIQKLKVVILGQDPYHTPNVATGLAFDVADYSKMQPSLKNIMLEFMEDTGKPASELNTWPEKGILLLNTALTVEESKPNSHKTIWEPFTKGLIAHISETCNSVVFLLWGANALSYIPFINTVKHKIIGSSHPSPFSYEKNCGKFVPFKGSKPFTQANKWFKTKKIEEIDW